MENDEATGIEGIITFLYYKDLSPVARFYEEIIGLAPAIVQSFARIYKVAGQGFLGIVDETRGYHRANPIKPVEITLLVNDVDAWYRKLRMLGVVTLTEPQTQAELGTRMFLLQDPEGYVIEIQKFL